MHSEPVFIEPFDLHLFNKGEHYELYRVLGAHPYTPPQQAHEPAQQAGPGKTAATVRQAQGQASAEPASQAGFRFAVWAPNAQEVCVVGEFTSWAWGELPLFPVGDSGIWAGFVPGLEAGKLYKFGIKGADGTIVYKADPFAFYSEYRPGVASITTGLVPYDWNDGEYMPSGPWAGRSLSGPSVFMKCMPVRGGGITTRSGLFIPTTNWPKLWFPMCATWASPTLNLCRWQNTRWTSHGGIRQGSIFPPAPALARRKH